MLRPKLQRDCNPLDFHKCGSRRSRDLQATGLGGSNMIIECVLAAVLGQAVDAGDRYPDRIRKLLSPVRSGTSQVEWTVTWRAGYDAGLVERYITRTAGDTVRESKLGDENGYHRTLFARSDNPS